MFFINQLPANCHYFCGRQACASGISLPFLEIVIILSACLLSLHDLCVVLGLSPHKPFNGFPFSSFIIPNLTHWIRRCGANCRISSELNYCVHSFVFHIHSRSLTYSHSSFIPSELFIVCLPPSNYSPISLSFLRNFNLKIASGFCLLRFGLFSCLFWWISILPFPLFHSIYCCSKFEYSMSRSVLLPLLRDWMKYEIGK